MYEDASRPSPFTMRAFAWSVAVHVGLFLLFWGASELMRRPPETIIPIDMTVVPPWAEQTNDPDPDPNPPPKDEPRPKPQPRQPDPEPVKKEDPKVEAVEKVVEKPKPKLEKGHLLKDAKLVKTPVQRPAPPDLRSQARKIDPPPNIKKFGKGTAADKPLSPEEFMRRMNEGYRIGSRNQLAASEEQRCMSLITQAIRRECEQDSFKWHQGLAAVQVEMSFGAGGRIVGYKLLKGSGDAAVDRLVMSAIGRLGSVPGLSSAFLQQFPPVGAVVEPLQM